MFDAVAAVLVDVTGVVVTVVVVVAPLYGPRDVVDEWWYVVAGSAGVSAVVDEYADGRVVAPGKE